MLLQTRIKQKMVVFASVLACSFWLYNFIVSKQTDLTLLLAPILVSASYFLSKRGPWLSLTPYLLLPIVESSYLAVSLVFICLSSRMSIKNFILICVAFLLVGSISFRQFLHKSVLTWETNPVKQMEINQKISLVPNRSLSRVYFNRTTPKLEKIRSNFFEIVDQNNYFYSFHPQEIPENQNLTKFPYWLLPFMIYGLYLVVESPFFFLFTKSVIAAVFGLTFVVNPDRLDIILLPSFCLLFYLSFSKIFKGKHE